MIKVDSSARAAAGRWGAWLVLSLLALFPDGPAPFHFLVCPMPTAQVWHQRGWLNATPYADPFPLLQDGCRGETHPTRRRPLTLRRHPANRCPAPKTEAQMTNGQSALDSGTAVIVLSSRVTPPFSAKALPSKLVP